MNTETRKRVSIIFEKARKCVRGKNYEGMNNERRKLAEMVRDKVTSSEVLRDFDGSMNYYYHIYHCM